MELIYKFFVILISSSGKGLLRTVSVYKSKIKKIEIKKADRTSFVGTFLNPIINLLVN